MIDEIQAFMDVFEREVIMINFGLDFDFTKEPNNNLGIWYSSKETNKAFGCFLLGYDVRNRKNNIDGGVNE